MTWFEGTHEETRKLDADAETVRAYLQDPRSIVAATKGLERAEVDGRVVHFVMEEEDHGVVSFKGEYRCRYEPTPSGVRWSSLPGGNLAQAGEASVEPAEDGGCTLHYRETVKVDLGVPTMMAPMLQPVVGPMLGKEVKAFVARLVEAIPR